MTAVVGTILGAFEITSTDKDTDFEGSATDGVALEEDISFLADWVTTGIQTVEIINLTIQSDQNLQWDISLYATDAHGNSDQDLDKIITTVNYATTDAIQTAAANQWRYDKNPTFIPFMYTDEDNSSKYHITLIPRGATKNAGATGKVVIKIHAVPVI